MYNANIEALSQSVEAGRICADDQVYKCVYPEEPWHAYRGVFF